MINDCGQDLPDLTEECSLCGDPTGHLHLHCDGCIEAGHSCCASTLEVDDPTALPRPNDALDGGIVVASKTMGETDEGEFAFVIVLMPETPFYRLVQIELYGERKILELGRYRNILEAVEAGDWEL